MEILIGLLGLLIGSFLNVCIYRIPRKESVSFPPSHCPICLHKIKWYENIPLISYILILRGKCSSCKSNISIQYPIVELLTGVLFFIFYKKYGYSIISLKYLILIPLLIIGTWVDFKEYYIPDRISISIIILGIISSLFTIGVERSLVGGGMFGLFFVLIYGFGESLGKEIMGFGDVKLAIGLGTIIGYFSLYQIFIFLNIAFVSGAIIGLLLIISKIKSRKDAIPFGPYIALSGLIMIYLN